MPSENVPRMVKFPGSQYSNSGSAAAAWGWVSGSGAMLSSGSSVSVSSLLVVAEEVLLEELVALEVEEAEELVLVSAGGSESGEEHAERMRVRAAPKSRAGDLRGMRSLSES